MHSPPTAPRPRSFAGRWLPACGRCTGRGWRWSHTCCRRRRCRSRRARVRADGAARWHRCARDGAAVQGARQSRGLGSCWAGGWGGMRRCLQPCPCLVPPPAADLQLMRVMERRFIIWTPPDAPPGTDFQRGGTASAVAAPQQGEQEEGQAAAPAPAAGGRRGQQALRGLRPLPRKSARGAARPVVPRHVGDERHSAPVGGPGPEQESTTGVAPPAWPPQQADHGLLGGAGAAPQRPPSPVAGTAWDAGLRGIWREFTERLAVSGAGLACLARWPGGVRRPRLPAQCAGSHVWVLGCVKTCPGATLTAPLQSHKYGEIALHSTGLPVSCALNVRPCCLTPRSVPARSAASARQRLPCLVQARRLGAIPTRCAAPPHAGHHVGGGEPAAGGREAERERAAPAGAVRRREAAGPPLPHRRLHARLLRAAVPRGCAR
jgi:hypothetical protein